MLFKYDVVVTVINLTDNSTSRFTKTMEAEVTAASDALLYNNHHVVANDVHLLDFFKDEINAYCKALEIEESSVEIEEFEMVSLSDKVDIYFEFSSFENEMSMKPTIKCYVHPKNDVLQTPKLVGIAYDSTTIIWSWPDDEDYAHYLIEEAIDPNDKSSQDKIIAQLPIGTTSYTETNLEADTAYTRRLINYTDEQTSPVSQAVTVRTETVNPTYSLEEYSVPKNYDFTTSDEERFMDTERFKAFHSGVGDFTDLKVYKQMDADFYQKFKAYFEITGRRIQREKRYDQVGFNYKICLEAMETIEEQEGEVTFDVDVYPREWVSIEDYMWATKPVIVKAKFQATVFLRKENTPSEDEEVTLYKPKFHEESTTTTIPSTSRKTALILSLDLSTSMRYNGDGTTKNKERLNAIKNAAKKAIDDFSDQIEDIEYVIVGWADDAHVEVANNAQTAKNLIDTMDVIGEANGYGIFNGVSVRNCTNWYIGLTAGIGYCSPDREVVGEIFFTDGFVNRSDTHDRPLVKKFESGSNTSSALHVNATIGADAANVLDSIRRGMKQFVNSTGGKIYGIFGQGVGKTDPDYSFSGNDRIKNTAFNEEAIWRFSCLKRSNVSSSNYYDGIYYPKYDATPDDAERAACGYVSHSELENNYNVENLYNVMVQGGLMVLSGEDQTIEGPPVTVFDGWELDTEASGTTVKRYELDSVKAVTITSDIYSFVFDNNITPSEYVRSEKRAIIPMKSFLENKKLVSTNLYDMIMAKVMQTAEWTDGYNKTIGTVETNGAPDKFLICGLFIWDTYEYADEDNPIISNTWGQEAYEDGMEGSVNVYTDIDKLGTTTYGDDCYLVSRDNYLMIQGYTDAIIYDGTRFVNSELNAYDRPQDILISASADYSQFLHNRKKPTLQYVGNGPISHVVDVIQRDRDIKLSGYDKLAKAGDWLLIGPLPRDLVASIETYYESPILNYRFNLEDPDAKTPLYEILPTCHPEDDFRHIVILHVYYAKNVWITNKDNYVAAFGDDPIATTTSPYMPLIEGLYKWTLKEWRDGINKENGWYIDSYLWFMAKPMRKTQEYYDELPGKGMETFYGLVNGRYRTDNQDGKKDLIVDTPQFNIPTTVHKNTIRIYIVISEFYPEDALVSYRWEHPYNGKDSITQVNGDYVTFSSDSVTYKDVEYYDIISTINMENQEIFDHKTSEYIYEIPKPETVYDYVNYYLKVETDNSDVLAMRYPTEITFDAGGTASVGVAFKGVVNATSKWSPRIHNGYYYLNQHEYFAYSEFNVEANFDTVEEENFKKINGYISLEVLLRHKASPKENYSITKDTRSELLQDEEAFQWINGSGLTLKPVISGEYYREYVPTMYYSPIIMFPNVLTSTGKLKVGYSFSDGSSYMPMEVRSYSVDDGKWSAWVPFTNNTVPSVPLSCAYQVRFMMQASVQNHNIFLEDYMCCYLDWQDDMSEHNTTNIVTITDHMTVGPDKGNGVYVSKIIDFGCVSQLMLDIFESHYKDTIQVYIAYTNNNPDSLFLENCIWKKCVKGQQYGGRYFRYKIMIPYGEKLYWLHKQVQTLETHEILPYVTSIMMSGEYSPKDVTQNFINTESFEILKDGRYHEIFDSVIKIIGADVLERGYKESEIESISITCTAPNVTINYDHNLDNKYPTASLASPILAKSDIDMEIVVKNTPFIFTEEADDGENTVVIIKGTPQQYCPITVEDPDGNSFVQLYNQDSFIQQIEYVLEDETKYIELPTNRYDPDRIKFYLDGMEMDVALFSIVNHLVIFNDFMSAGHTVTVELCILYSFIPVIDRKNNTTTIYLHTGEAYPMPDKVKVYFETGTRNNKFVANELSLNPIYRTDYNGFIYLTDDHNEPYAVRIFCNPMTLKAGGFDSVDISVEVVDIWNNPVISKEVIIDCKYGILNCDSYITDMNGVVHLVYESAYIKCKDTFTVTVLKDDGTAVRDSIEIINE